MRSAFKWTCGSLLVLTVLYPATMLLSNKPTTTSLGVAQFSESAQHNFVKSQIDLRLPEHGVADGNLLVEHLPRQLVLPGLKGDPRSCRTGECRHHALEQLWSVASFCREFPKDELCDLNIIRRAPQQLLSWQISYCEYFPENCSKGTVRGVSDVSGSPGTDTAQTLPPYCQYHPDLPDCSPVEKRHGGSSLEHLPDAPLPTIEEQDVTESRYETWVEWLESQEWLNFDRRGDDDELDSIPDLALNGVARFRLQPKSKVKGSSLKGTKATIDNRDIHNISGPVRILLWTLLALSIFGILSLAMFVTARRVVRKHTWHPPRSHVTPTTGSAGPSATDGETIYGATGVDEEAQRPNTAQNHATTGLDGVNDGRTQWIQDERGDEVGAAICFLELSN